MKENGEEAGGDEETSECNTELTVKTIQKEGLRLKFYSNKVSPSSLSQSHSSKILLRHQLGEANGKYGDGF